MWAALFSKPNSMANYDENQRIFKEEVMPVFKEGLLLSLLTSRRGFCINGEGGTALLTVPAHSILYCVLSSTLSSESEVAQLCPTLCHPMDCRLPHSWDFPWDFPGKSIGVGCHFLLQGIFPTQGSNLGLLHCRQMLYHLSHQGSLSSSNI